MTDAATPDPPRTAAGRALVARLTSEADPEGWTANDSWNEDILAIEAEAAALARPSRADLEAMTKAERVAYVQEREVAAIDRLAQARPAVASEGLLAALEALDGLVEAYVTDTDPYAVDDALQQARVSLAAVKYLLQDAPDAALASDAGSVGAEHMDPRLDDPYMPEQS